MDEMRVIVCSADKPNLQAASLEAARKCYPF